MDPVEETSKENIIAYLQTYDTILSCISFSPLITSYQSNYKKALENQLWEYAVNILWKTVILFFYEKMFQLSKINGLNDSVQSNLENNNRDCITPFSFNCLKDDKIFENMHLLWRNLDSNYKNIFRALQDERNSLSHVNEYPYSELKFGGYLEKTSQLIEYVQNLHLKQFSKIRLYIEEKGMDGWVSTKEIEELIESTKINYPLLVWLASSIELGQLNNDLLEKVIDQSILLLLNSPYREQVTLVNENILNKLLPFFDSVDITVLLQAIILKNKKEILLSSSTENIFIYLYTYSRNNYPELLSEWQKMKEYITELELNKKYKLFFDEFADD